MDRLLTWMRPLWAIAFVASGLCAAAPGAAADAAHGKSVFASQCSMCHSDARNGATILGPPLFGVVGRPAGSVKGFNYSAAMKGSGITWTEDQLRAYLPAPNKLLPGVRMTFWG